MRELALHILDIAQNSLRAGAKHIAIEINENENGFFVFRIIDDGCGMSKEMLSKVRDPFTTSRKTRQIGMGIPFLDMVTQQCLGHLELTSTVGKGTQIAAYFAADNIDRPPLGNIAESLRILLAGAPNINLKFTYVNANKKMEFNTDMVREVLGEECDFANPIISAWLDVYLKDNIVAVQSREDD